MKAKLMTAVSALALLAAAPAVAADAGSIDVGMSWGQEDTGMKSNFLIGHVSGQLEFGIDDGWNGQVEAFASSSNSGTSTWYGKYSDNTGLSTYGATVHANTTIGDWQLGPFLMLESTTVGDAGFNNGYGAGQNAYLAFGGDVKWNATPDLDLTGQVGGLFNIATPDNAPDTSVLNNAFFANLGGTYFFDDNNAISANVAYLSGEGGSCMYYWYNGGNCYASASSQTGWDYGATFIHQFDDSPFAAYVAYDGNAFAWDGYVQHDNVVTLGVKFFFNGDSVRGQHTTAGFKTPHFERMINQSASLDDMAPVMVSDRRLKRDIHLLATLANGMKIYSFRYNWSDEVHVGVMAQDLLAHRAWRGAVVSRADGFYAVNYAKLGLKMCSLAEWQSRGLAAILDESYPFAVAA